MTIHLALMLPSGSSDLPGGSGGPPSGSSLFGLAPDGVCLAPDVTARTGKLFGFRTGPGTTIRRGDNPDGEWRLEEDSGGVEPDQGNGQ
jgi:hypothetical protein